MKNERNWKDALQDFWLDVNLDQGNPIVDYVTTLGCTIYATWYFKTELKRYKNTKVAIKIEERKPKIEAVMQIAYKH